MLVVLAARPKILANILPRDTSAFPSWIVANEYDLFYVCCRQAASFYKSTSLLEVL